MAKADDGGKAFPNGAFQDGMKMRDYFAAQFLPTAFEQAAQPKEYDLAAIFGKQTGLRREEIAAAFAYRMADAMIARRAD